MAGDPPRCSHIGKDRGRKGVLNALGKSAYHPTDLNALSKSIASIPNETTEPDQTVYTENILYKNVFLAQSHPAR